MAITNGPLLNSVPATTQMALATNYLDLSSAANAGWGQQYLPDLMEKEAEVFGPRCLLIKLFGLSKVVYIYLI